MKIQLKRDGEILEIKNFAIEVNGNRYRISETIEGRVTINKVSIDGDDDYIKVHPRSGNEIDVSQYYWQRYSALSSAVNSRQNIKVQTNF